jgi:hypothetical protein
MLNLLNRAEDAVKLRQIQPARRGYFKIILQNRIYIISVRYTKAGIYNKTPQIKITFCRPLL